MDFNIRICNFRIKEIEREWPGLTCENFVKADVLREQALTYAARGQHARAMQDYDQAIPLHPRDPKA